MPPNFKNFKKKEETQNQPQQDNSPNQSQATQQQQQSSPNQTQKAPEKKYGGFWEEQEDKIQPQKTVQQQPAQSKGKPNFLKKEQPAPPPVPVQPQQQVNQVVEEPVQKQNENTTTTQPEVQNMEKQIKQVDNKVQNNSNIPLSKQFKVQSEYDLIQPEQLENPLIQFEGKSVEEVIAPGGVRLKQNQNILDEFNYSAANFQTPIVGSFLISKLYSTLNFQQKIRALYAIQELIRKQEKYQKYFKHHIQVIKSATTPEGDNTNAFSQEINIISTLVDNPNATVANEHVEVKFEFKSNLLPVNPKNNNKGPSSILSPHSDTNNTSYQNSQNNTANYLDEFDQQEQQASEQKKKGFDIIKKNQLNKNENDNGVRSQQNIDEVQENQQQENKQTKKGFSFLKKKQEVHSVQQIESPQPEVIQNQQKEATNQQPKKNAFQFIKKQNSAQTNQPQQLQQHQNANGNGVYYQDNYNPINQETKQIPQSNGTNGHQSPVTNITNQFDSLSINGNQLPNSSNTPGNQYQNQSPYGGQFPQHGGFSPYGQQASVPPHGFYPPNPQYGAYGMYPPPPYGYPPAGYPYPYGYGHPPQGYGQPIPPYGYPPYPQGYGQNFIPPQQEQKQETQENKEIKKDTREDAFNFIKI
ncbi:hypothetical protein ABPG72_007759 [Tetrahymena utriculariae]